MEGPIKIVVAELTGADGSNELFSITADASLLKEKHIFISREDERKRYQVVQSRIEISDNGALATLFVQEDTPGPMARLLTWLGKLDGDWPFFVSMFLFFIPFFALIASAIVILTQPLETLGWLVRYSGYAAVLSVLVLFVWLGSRQKFEVIRGAFFFGSLISAVVAGILVAIFWNTAFDINFGEMSNKDIGTAVMAGRTSLIAVLAPYAPSAAILLKWVGWPVLAGLVKENVKVKTLKQQSAEKEKKS